MSLPNTLQGLPARTSWADSLGLWTFTFVALYRGQASSTAGSTSTARATSAAVPSKERNPVTTLNRRGVGSIVGKTVGYNVHVPRIEFPQFMLDAREGFV
jgi:hypothetical protein